MERFAEEVIPLVREPEQARSKAAWEAARERGNQCQTKMARRSPRGP